MTETATPVLSRIVQDRPSKRSRVSPACSSDASFDQAINLLIKGEQVPVHLKTIVGHLVDKLSSVELLIKKNCELEDRLKEEAIEKKRLQDEVDSRERCPVVSLVHPRNFMWVILLLI
ncbi:hypothetical protein Aduo_015217 [Ancylostoma duodenale]